MKDASETLDLVGCGSMVVDLIYRAARLPAGDQKVLLRSYARGGATERRFIGGVTLNHLGWASALGLRAGIFGKIGDDAYGAFLRQGIDRFGIEQHLTRDGSASSFACVFVDPAGNRAIYMSRGATAELSPEEIRRRHGGFIRRARVVSTEISQLPLKTVIAILLYARAHSIPTVLDVDLPPSHACPMLGTPRELERALRLANILKPAKAAARELIGKSAGALQTAAAMLNRYGSQAVVITDGARGCAIASRESAIKVPGFSIKAVDSTGAGDAFLGAMVAGLHWQLPWRTIGRLANAAGAICASQFGACPAGPDANNKIAKLYGSDLPAAPVARSSAAESSTPPGSLDSSLQIELDRFLELCLSEMAALRRTLNLDSIWSAVEMIRDAESRGGRVHVTGVGKSEHVARYVASLLCSVGTAATFLHATETLHGSLGQVHRHDVVIAISNSGDTQETLAAARAIREHGAKVIAVTGNLNSELAKDANLALHAPIEREGGLLGLAPRISVLGQVYVLAALSVALEAAHGLTLEQYSRWHKAGALGQAARRLAAKRANGHTLRAV